MRALIRLRMANATGTSPRGRGGARWRLDGLNPVAVPIRAAAQAIAEVKAVYVRTVTRCATCTTCGGRLPNLPASNEMAKIEFNFGANKKPKKTAKKSGDKKKAGKKTGKSNAWRGYTGG
jgi:hypothetical protein